MYAFTILHTLVQTSKTNNNHSTEQEDEVDTEDSVVKEICLDVNDFEQGN